MTLTSKLVSYKIKIILWVLLATGIISLSVVIFLLINSNNAASSVTQPITARGTCYLYDFTNNTEPPGLLNTQLNECKKHTDNVGQGVGWYMFCYNNVDKYDPGCVLRAALESKGQQGPNFDPTTNFKQTGFCHLATLGKIIPNRTYAQCRQYDNWISFELTDGHNKKTLYRRGVVKIKYHRKRTVPLDDLTANCVLRDNDPVNEPKKRWGYACINSQQWCSYDNPSFCVKNPNPS